MRKIAFSMLRISTLGVALILSLPLPMRAEDATSIQLAANSVTKQACLDRCRKKMRAIPGFSRNRYNQFYCKDQCGVPHGS